MKKTIRIQNPKDWRITILNLLYKIEQETPNDESAHMEIQFNSTSIDMKFRMNVWYGFIWEDDIPSDDPVWFYNFQDDKKKETRCYFKTKPTEILQNINVYIKIAEIEEIVVEYGEDINEEE